MFLTEQHDVLELGLGSLQVRRARRSVAAVEVVDRLDPHGAHFRVLLRAQQLVAEVLRGLVALEGVHQQVLLGLVQRAELFGVRRDARGEQHLQAEDAVARRARPHAGAGDGEHQHARDDVRQALAERHRVLALDHGDRRHAAFVELLQALHARRGRAVLPACDSAVRCRRRGRARRATAAHRLLHQLRDRTLERALTADGLPGLGVERDLFVAEQLPVFEHLDDHGLFEGPEDFSAASLDVKAACARCIGR